MNYVIVAFLILVTPAFGLAAGQTDEVASGVGYLAKADGTKVYEHSAGDAVATTVKKDFPMVAYESRNSWLGMMASESVENGRAHVRYWKNGLNTQGGETIAWVDLKDTERFQFGCCGDSGHCSGITNPLFSTGGYTDCFTQAMETTIQKRTVTTGNGGTELDKLKYQLELEKVKLEIQKLKLEQERLKGGSK